MQNDLFKLEDIINVAKFQKIQDDIAKATDMALLTVDFKGVPFTGHSQCQLHCTKVRELPQYRDLCQKCDSRGGLEAARLQKPYIYICHRGLIDLAVPIIVNGQYLGAMMAGQVRLSDPSEGDALENIVTKKSPVADLAFQTEIDRLHNNLPHMPLSKIQAIASMLFHICQYIVEQALLKTSISHFQQQGSTVELSEPNLPYAEKESLTFPLPIPTAKEDLLKPAFEFMDNHLTKHIYIEQMATLCNVSISYFSKCFNKATGMNFSAYQNHKKVEKAVELLETSNRTISELSYDLGFETSGYFIKLFKQQIGVTPAVYRQQYQQMRHLNYTIQHSK